MRRSTFVVRFFGTKRCELACWAEPARGKAWSLELLLEDDHSAVIKVGTELVLSSYQLPPEHAIGCVSLG